MQNILVVLDIWNITLREPVSYLNPIKNINNFVLTDIQLGEVHATGSKPSSVTSASKVSSIKMQDAKYCMRQRYTKNICNHCLSEIQIQLQCCIFIC